MGNCIEKCENSPVLETEAKKAFDEEEIKDFDDGKEKSGKMMRIKIVLTKEELEWFMGELENKEAGKKRVIEDVLVEIQRNREKSSSSSHHVAWKPSLDSIIESPEVPESMDR